MGHLENTETLEGALQLNSGLVKATDGVIERLLHVEKGIADYIQVVTNIFIIFRCHCGYTHAISCTIWMLSYKSILSPHTLAHSNSNLTAREPGVQANALATRPVIMRFLSNDFPLSALFLALM